MTEHEKLKEICEMIGYKTWMYKYVLPDLSIHRPEWLSWFNIKRDVREIIFTQEFMDKFFPNINMGLMTSHNEFSYELLHNLNNPVDYLYNLIK